MKLIKYGLDYCIAIFLIILTAPLFLATYLIIRIQMGRPVFFTQTRPGQRERLFNIYKFRTMKNTRDHNGELLPDHLRMTRLGKLIRGLSLDELPQLFNILKGEISLVGPRPLLVQYLELYSEDEKRRHHVRPGITGWAQVNGRNSITWKEKFQLDLWYVENWSLWLDFKILLLTFVSIIKRSDIEHEDHVTMPAYNGEN